MKRHLLVPSTLTLFLLVGWGTLHGDDAGYGERIEARPKYGDPPAVWVGPDQRTVLIRSTGGACDNYVRIRVQERPHTVKIAITVRPFGGRPACPAIAFSRGYKVVLNEPLRNRKLIAIDDVAYDRISERPAERSEAFNRKVPVIVEFE